MQEVDGLSFSLVAAHPRGAGQALPGTAAPALGPLAGQLPLWSTRKMSSAASPAACDLLELPPWACLRPTWLPSSPPPRRP